MAGRVRNIRREVQALELRVAGQSQREVASTLGISVRTVSRYEQRWRDGDRPLPEVLAALWSAYDREQQGWRRVRLLQSLAKVAVVQAQLDQESADRDLLNEVREHQTESPQRAWCPVRGGS
ncbi:MAG TPA: hypothetical protein DEA08_25600 [Planctomycetes bacterium]|nr:hypothetical protein [Planctomycetota bacterium]